MGVKKVCTPALVAIMLVGATLSISFPSIAGNPSEFATVEEMIKEFHDYSTENGTFKILKANPLHIQLAPRVVPGDFPQVIEDQVKRALVYGIYRAFIHTQIQEITVTAVPQEIDIKTSKSQYLTGYQRTISKKRQEALALVQKYLRVNSLSELVTNTNAGGVTFADQWTKDFKRLYYNDQGFPGLNRFVGELSK